VSKFPVDAPKGNVIKALEKLGFRLVREKEHISMERDNPVCTQAGIPREDFLQAYEKH
jgi:hypothetical protein